ncbi:MAG: ABC transporter ATP-binding protein [Acidobacteriota bacterium]
MIGSKQSDDAPARLDQPAIEARGLSKRFGPKLALHGFDLEIERGGIHAVVGANGAGKSTFFRILLGFQTATAGTSRVLGYRSEALPPAVRGRIQLVTEEHALPGWMRIGALEAMHRDLATRSRSNGGREAAWSERAWREVAGLFRLPSSQRVRDLSRGERAGLNLALALAQRPELLILDEPTLGLDVVARQAFLEALLFAGEHDGSTILYCSHQMDEVERVADALIILEDGRVTEHGTPESFWRRIAGWSIDAASLPPAGALLPEALPGLLQTRAIDGRLQLTAIDRDDDFGACLESLGAVDVQRVPIGFDRAVNAYLDRPAA